MHLGILQQRTDRRVFGNQLQIARINLDDVHRFQLRKVRDDLSPRPRGQSEHKNSLRRGSEGRKSVRPNDEIDLIGWIGVEISVVNAAAEKRCVLGYGDNAVSIFDHTRKGHTRLRPSAKDEPFEEQGMSSTPPYHQSYGRDGDTGQPDWQNAKLAARKKLNHSAANYSCETQLKRYLP